MQTSSLKASEAKLGPDHPATLRIRNNLAIAYRAAGRTAEAEPVARDSLEGARRRFKPADPRIAGAMAQLATSLIQQGKWLAAEPVLRECLALRERIEPDEWSTFNARSLLGGSLLGQKKYAQAEPLILDGYEGLKAREAKIPAHARSRLSEAAGRIGTLYESWGMADKAAEWRTKLGRPADDPKHQP